MNEKSFDTFYKVQKGSPHRFFVEHSLKFCNKFNCALDLGAGNLIDADFLTTRFEKVVAVDRNSAILDFEKELSNSKLECLVVDFKNAEFEQESFDYISSLMALPFYGKVGFQELISKIVSWMKSDAIFVFQLFGDRHDWNTEASPKKFMSEEEIHKLLGDLNLELVFLKEFEYVMEVGANIGTKFHTFNVIVKKK